MLEREIESLLEDAVKDGGAQPLLVNGVLAVLLHDLEHRQVVEHHKLCRGHMQSSGPLVAHSALAREPRALASAEAPRGS
eukprot:6619157-Prymnesium_polylepis.1